MKDRDLLDYKIIDLTKPACIGMVALVSAVDLSFFALAVVTLNI